MNTMKAILFFIFLSCSTASVYAQTWNGSVNTRWDEPANWTPAGVPTAASSVVFNIASPPNNCVLDIAATISQFQITNGSISLTATGSLLVNSTFSVSGGNFDAGSGTVSIPNNTFSITGGTFNNGSATIFIGSNVDLNTNATIIKGTGHIVFNGPNDQTVNTTWTITPHILHFHKVTLDKPGTALLFAGTSTDTFEIDDSAILKNGQFQGSVIVKVEKNVWVQSGFDGSAMPITFTGTQNSVLRLDTTFASLIGSSVIIKKSTPSTTVSIIRANPTDTIRTGNFNADLVVTTGILQFPDNPPVISRFRNITIQPGGTFQSTSNYLYNAGAHTNTGGIFLHNNGTYVFNQPAIPAVTQFTNHVENFNNLIVDIAGAQFNPSASDTLIVNGNLTLRGGTITGGANSALNIKSNMIFESTMDNTQNNTKLVISGTTDQSISFATAAIDRWNASVTLNKPSGLVILNSPWTLDFPNQVFTFTRGIVSIPDTANNYIYFTNAYSVAGASAVSYVDGPVRVKRWANDPFEFPIGNDGFYAPIRISDFWASTEDVIFSAQYFHQPSEFASNPAVPATLANISKQEWWRIKRVTGAVSLPPYLWLSYDNVRSGGVTTPSALRVSKWNLATNTWEDHGNGLVNPPFIRSNQPITEFSPFTLASTSALLNPLPLHLLSFTASSADSYNLLQWIVTNEINFDKYIIESSDDGSNYQGRGSIPGTGRTGELNYSFNDSTLAIKTFYRLKMQDKDGRFEYSPVRIVNRNVKGFTANVFPNPGTDLLNLQVESESRSNATIRIIDLNGKILFERNIVVQKGTNYYNYSLPQMARGVWFINIITDNGEQKVLRYLRK